MKTKLLLSSVLACLFGLVTFFVLLLCGDPSAFLSSVMVAILLVVLLFPCLVISGRITDRRSAAADASIDYPVYYKTTGNVASTKKVRNAFFSGSGAVNYTNIYFCEDRIVFACLDKKPYAKEEVLLPEVAHYRFDLVHLHILTRDNRAFSITSSDAERVTNLLKEKNWITTVITREEFLEELQRNRIPASPQTSAKEVTRAIQKGYVVVNSNAQGTMFLYTSSKDYTHVGYPAR